MCLADTGDVLSERKQVGNVSHCHDHILVGDDESPVEMTSNERRFSNRIFFGNYTDYPSIEAFCKAKLSRDPTDLMGSLNGKLSELGAKARFKILDGSVVFTTLTTQECGSQRF